MNRAITALLTPLIVASAVASLRAQAPAGVLPPPAAQAVTPPAPGVVPGSPLAAALADAMPASLPPPAEAPTHVPGPYFEHDPLLDPSELPQPGWLAEIQGLAANPHVRYWSNLRGPVRLPGGVTDFVSVPGAHLSWAASPAILLGYRLPSGFGEFTIGYRYLASDGTQTLPELAGPSSVRSRLDMNLVDFDYRSRELSLWPWLDMKWWAGGRFSNLYFDSNQSTNSTLAGTGTEVSDRHVTNRFVGFGPHAGLELAYFLHEREWSLLGRIEGAGMLGRITQGFSETTTTSSGTTAYSSSQDVPTINVQIGLRWQPSCGKEVFFGYQYEYFWNAGRESSVPTFTTNTSGTQAEVYDHAIVLRVSCDF
jgi:hypothetical protein